MNNFSPDQMYQVIDQRHADIRNIEAARYAADQAKGSSSNRLKSLWNNIQSFGNHLSIQSDEASVVANLRQRNV